MPIKKYLLSKTYRWLLKSYTLIFLLSYVCFSIVMVIYFYDSYRSSMNNLANQTRIDLSYAFSDLERYLDEFDKTSRQIISYDLTESSFTPAAPTSANQLQARLRAYQIVQARYSDIWYYHPGDDYLFSGYDSNLFANFAERHFSIEGYNAASFQDFLTTNTTQAIIRAYDQNSHTQVIFFIYPINKSFRQLPTTIIFVCSETVLQESLNRILLQNDGLAGLYTPDGLLLTHYARPVSGLDLAENELAAPSDPALNRSAVPGAAGQADIGIDQIPLSYNWIQMRATSSQGWQMVVRIKNSDLSFWGLVVLPLSILLFVLASGAWMISVSANNKYAPIRAIRRSIHDILLGEDSDDLACANDYDDIQSCMEQLKNDVQDNSGHIRTYLTQSLLFGKFRQPDVFNEATASFGFPELRSRHVVFVLLLRDADGLPAEWAKAFTRAAEKSFAGLGTLYTTSIATDSPATGQLRLVGIFSADQSESIDLVKPCSELARHLATASGAGDPRQILGIGSWVSAVNEIPVSLTQAIAACNRIVLQPDQTIHSFAADNSQSAGEMAAVFGWPSLLVGLQSGYTGSGKLLPKMIRDINEASKQADLSSVDWQRFLITLFTEFARYADRFIHDFACVDLFTVFLMLDKADQDQLQALFGNFGKILENELLVREPDKALAVFQAMQNYLVKNYNDPTFSVKSMADHFNMSVPALSKYFKGHSSRTLIDEITDRKMNMAMHLLRTTNMSVQDISLAVGYYNLTSFIRRFRQIVRMPPGNYRKLYGQNPGIQE